MWPTSFPESFCLNLYLEVSSQVFLQQFQWLKFYVKCFDPFLGNSIQIERNGFNFILLHIISNFLTTVYWRGWHFFQMYFCHYSQVLILMVPHVYLWVLVLFVVVYTFCDDVMLCYPLGLPRMIWGQVFDISSIFTYMWLLRQFNVLIIDLTPILAKRCINTVAY